MDRKKNRKRRIWLIVAALALILIAGAFAWYVSDYYHAEPEAFELFSDSRPDIQVKTTTNQLVFSPEHPRAGLIFYPGGKVETEAYAPLMTACAERGILCVLMPMPFHLAVLNENAADGVPEQFPEISDWYIGGHSLGGVMAAMYAAEHADEFSGVVLLGAYSTANLRKTNLRVLSLYGSEDGVMDREAYRKNRPNLPDSTEEFVIEGGNHAGFGCYGEQAGDGSATVTAGEQQTLTADRIDQWMER